MRSFLFPPFFRGYTTHFLKKDLGAAFFVALMTIPQSIAYSLLAGLPPVAGLFSAIFGAILMGAFGSSPFLVAGPSTGVAILLQSAIAETLLRYPQEMRDMVSLEILGSVVLMIAVLHIILGLLRIGSFLQFVSKPVILGYFSGVVLAIIVRQLFSLLGITLPQDSTQFFVRLGHLFVNIYTLKPDVAFVGIFSFFLLIVLSKRKKLPAAFLVLIISSFLCFFWFTNVPRIDSLRSSSSIDWQFSLPVFDFKLLQDLLPSAIAIAFLSLLEVFSISREMAAKSGHAVKANQDVLALGFTNFFLSFLHGAMPATGSLSRSTLNVQKAKTRLSVILSSLFVLVMVLFAWPFIRLIPLPAVAAILIFIVPSFLQKNEIRLCFKATREDRLVFLLTMGGCLVFTLDMAFFIGIIIAIASYLRKAAVPSLMEYSFNAAGHLIVVMPSSTKHRKVRIIGVGGELFFGAVDLFQTTLQAVANDPSVKVIVLRLNGVHYMDATMCLAIIRLLEYLKATNRHLLISGINEDVWKVLYHSGVIKEVGEENLFIADETKPQLSTWKASLRAEDLVN